MLLYPHSFAGIPLLLSATGSAIPRAVIPAFCAFLLTTVIEETISQEYLNHIFAHPYPYTIFANLVGFTLIYRTNIAYSRYWEGISQCRQMSSKWGDAALHVMSMDCLSKPPASPPEPGQPTLASTRSLYRAAVCHRFSLMHGLAIAHLRREAKLRKFAEAPIPASSRSSADRRPIKEAAYSARYWDGWRQALWPSQYESFLEQNPLPVLGGVSDAERGSLELLNSEERVHAEFARVLASVNSRRAAGGLNVDPPAVSRIHQTLSDGNLGFYQACKLEDTPLPFPYAQMVSLVLCIFAVSYPLLASAKASGYEGYHAHWLAPLLSFVVVLAYFGLYEVARELEDPFIHPPNEAPLVAMQQSFNARLLSGWGALEDMYASECVPEGTEGLGLRAITTTAVEALEAAWQARHEHDHARPTSPHAQRARVGDVGASPPSALGANAPDTGAVQLVGTPDRPTSSTSAASSRNAPQRSPGRTLSGMKVPRNVQVTH